jgi:hypothetical protein
MKGDEGTTAREGVSGQSVPMLWWATDIIPLEKSGAARRRPTIKSRYFSGSCSSVTLFSGSSVHSRYTSRL